MNLKYDAGDIYLKDLIFYTGLAYIDLVMLRPTNIAAGTDGMQWIRTSRKKTEIPVNVPGTNRIVSSTMGSNG
jgi:hypothetical protein